MQCLSVSQLLKGYALDVRKPNLILVLSYDSLFVLNGGLSKQLHIDFNNQTIHSDSQEGIHICGTIIYETCLFVIATTQIGTNRTINCSVKNGGCPYRCIRGSNGASDQCGCNDGFFLSRNRKDCDGRPPRINTLARCL